MYHGRFFILQMHQPDGSVTRLPPVDAVRQPMDFIKYLLILVNKAVCFTNEEDDGGFVFAS